MKIPEMLYSNLMQLLVLLVGSVLIVLILVLKKRVQEWLKKHVVRDVVESDGHIKELLVEIRITTKADRVSIFLFHNGERYVNGNSILRLSGAYESLSSGIGSHRDSSQNILVSTVSEAVSFLVNDPFEKVDFQKVDDLDECFYKAVLISQGVQSIAKYPLRKNEDIIGFLCADFVKSEGPDDEMLEVIKNTAPQIELHLNNRGRRLKGFLAKLLLGGG